MSALFENIWQHYLMQKLQQQLGNLCPICTGLWQSPIEEKYLQMFWVQFTSFLQVLVMQVLNEDLPLVKDFLTHHISEVGYDLKIYHQCQVTQLSMNQAIRQEVSAILNELYMETMRHVYAFNFEPQNL